MGLYILGVDRGVACWDHIDLVGRNGNHTNAQHSSWPGAWLSH